MTRPLTRVSDWDQRLADYIETVATKPHAYGRHDCMLFVAGAVRAITGRDLARGHRGKYRSAATSARYLKGLGYSSPAEMITSHLDPVEPAFAQRGDVVLSRGGALGTGQVPGICIGAKAVFVGMDGDRDGLITLPMPECSAAWRVGHHV